MSKASKNKSVVPASTLRRIRKPGDVKTLQRKLWQAVVAAEDLLLARGLAHGDQVRAVHALVQSGLAYAKILETTALQEQIDALKAELSELRMAAPLRKVVG